MPQTPLPTPSPDQDEEVEEEDEDAAPEKIEPRLYISPYANWYEHPSPDVDPVLLEQLKLRAEEVSMGLAESPLKIATASP